MEKNFQIVAKWPTFSNKLQKQNTAQDLHTMKEFFCFALQCYLDNN